ncbi:MAG: polyphosphate kinase 2 [Pseudomonadales bacterium]|nr:polyphosphate kinase 2 [Pseudomonadales bacterium]
MKKSEYKKTLRALQIELVKLQRHFISANEKILVLLEGRDAAGKDGVVKRIVQHLSPRDTRVVALGKPSDRDNATWYFQRYVPHLPASQEFVLFNRSWYNRAGVERVMGFCTEQEYEHFIPMVIRFEEMLADAGIRFRKYFLDISRDEQRKRLEDRAADPLSNWKISPIDREAQARWKAYSEARDEMLVRTHHSAGPWYIVRADDKKIARVNLIKDLLGSMDYEGKDASLVSPDPEIVFEYRADIVRSHPLAK